MTATAPGTLREAIFVEETGAHWFQNAPLQGTLTGLGLAG